MKNPLALYEQLQVIRMTASVLYDRGRAMDLTHEKLSEDIAPLKEAQKDLIEEAVKNELGSVICTIKQYEADAKAHLDVIRFLQEKAEDSKAHAQNLLDEIKRFMEK